MIVLALLLSTVQPEPVEGRPAPTSEGRPSTSSGRTGEEPRTVVDAERAFAADAQVLGQWASFRKWAAADAVMFVPQPTNAQAWLKDRKEPPKAVAWSPTASFIACDGKWAVNTGEWRGGGGGTGYFTTVWHRDAAGRWRWLVDGGDQLAAPRSQVPQPKVERARCGGKGRANGFRNEAGSGFGASDDATLRWRWHVAPDGARTFTAELWDGHGYRTVVDDRIAAPPPPTTPKPATP